MMRRSIASLFAAIGLVLLVSMTAPAAPAPSQPIVLSQASADLTWFVVGLRDLGKSRDARLKLLPAQAKKILPVLEKLAADGILVTQTAERQASPGGQSSGNRQGGGGLTEKERQEMQARQQKMAERVQQAINSMDGMLRQAQSDYILGLDFDPAVYGLDRSRDIQLFQGQGQRPARPSCRRCRKRGKKRDIGW